MRFVKHIAVLISAMLLFGCAGIASEAAPAENLAPLSGRISFDNSDLSDAFDAEKAIAISLTGKSAECTSGYVEIFGGCITITKAGTYILSGRLDGMIIVHADKQDTVRIILDNAEISSSDSAAIYVRSARKTIISCAGGSKNRLSNGGEYIDIDDSNIDAVIFSKDDLSINGMGLLEIDAQAGHGVVSKDSLHIADANITVSAASHALSAKDDIGINGGIYKFSSGKDGVHAENKDDANSGDALILGGDFEITSAGDGISAASILEISGGNFAIHSGGGYENAEPHADDFMRFRSAGSAGNEDAASCKAFKSGGNMYINGGAYDINSADDALHSDADLRISSGNFSMLSGDDALHAENNLSVYGGEFDIAYCYEGLEAHTIDVYGGIITLSSGDDGMNAAGGSDGSGMGEGFRMDNPFISDPEAYIRIHGGSIEMYCEGDGIDSNGEIRIYGGETYIHGPATGANGSLDCGTAAYIEGGRFIAAGSAGMAEHFSAESGQCSLIMNANGEAGSKWSVSDASGETIFDFTAGCDFQCIVMSLPEFEIGESYTLSSGDTSLEINFDSKLYSGTNSRGFGGMMNPGGRMQMPRQDGFGRGWPDFNGSFQLPEGFTPPGDMQMPEGMTPPSEHAGN